MSQSKSSHNSTAPSHPRYALPSPGRKTNPVSHIASRQNNIWGVTSTQPQEIEPLFFSPRSSRHHRPTPILLKKKKASLLRHQKVGFRSHPQGRATPNGFSAYFLIRVGHEIGCADAQAHPRALHVWIFRDVRPVEGVRYLLCFSLVVRCPSLFAYCDDDC